MALQYIPHHRNQGFLLPPDMAEWLSSDHLAWFVLDVVERVDTAELHRRHPNAGVGRAAYDPDMMLALLIYAYCTGQRSSRVIEGLCGVDIAYRVICGNTSPDHTTIARFRKHHAEMAKKLFGDVLELAKEAGAARVGLVALDGTKMEANASLKANRSREAIEAEVARMMEEAAQTDAAEDELYGEARGDELPEELRDPGSRRARLEAARAAIERRAAETSEPTNGELRERAKAREEKARKDLERTRANVRATELKEAEAAAAGKRRVGRPNKAGGSATLIEAERRMEVATDRREAAEQACVKEGEGERTGNVTDPDSRILSTQKGWVQGYNAQAGVNEEGIVLVADVLDEVNDYGCFEPMLSKLKENLEAVGIEEPVGVVIVDAGYLSEDNLKVAGPDRLIATGKARTMRKEEVEVMEEPLPPTATPMERNQWRLRTSEGRLDLLQTPAHDRAGVRSYQGESGIPAIHPSRQGSGSRRMAADDVGPQRLQAVLAAGGSSARRLKRPRRGQLPHHEG